VTLLDDFRAVSGKPAKRALERAQITEADFESNGCDRQLALLHEFNCTLDANPSKPAVIANAGLLTKERRKVGLFESCDPRCGFQRQRFSVVLLDETLDSTETHDLGKYVLVDTGRTHGAQPGRSSPVSHDYQPDRSVRAASIQPELICALMSGAMACDLRRWPYLL